MTDETRNDDTGFVPRGTQSKALAPTQDQDRTFTEAFLANGWDATKAARAAGYPNASSVGHRRISRPDMQALIDERIEASAVRTDEVLGSLVVIMREHTGSDEAAMVKNAIAAATQLCKILGMHQRARANQHDQVTRDRLEEVIVRQIQEHGLTRREVIARIIAINPELRRWVATEADPTD